MAKRKTTSVQIPISLANVSVRWLFGAVIAALVLIFFWAPVWTFIIDVSTKARGLFGKG